MNIFDPHISGSLSVSGSGEISGDLRVLGTINATISGTTSNAISASHAAEYTLTSSFHQFTSSYTTGAFTGSFIGDGSGLNNIPASGVTGLNLTQIADGGVTASVSDTNGLRVNSKTEITGSLTVTGDIIGSADFDTLRDKPTLVSGSSQITISDTTGYSTFSSSIATTDLNQSNRLTSIEDKTGSYATTGSNLFKGTQTHSGSILPSVDNTYDLGSVEYQWRDVYISSGSLYIDGTKVISSTAQELVITTDNGQSIKILEGTTDSIVLQTADGDIELKSSADGDILLDPTNGKILLKGPIEVLSGQKIQSSVGGTPVVFASDIVVSGSIDLTGTIDGIDLNSLSSSLNTRIGSIETSTTSINSFTSSASGRLSSIETSTSSLNDFTSSINTTIKSKLDTESVISGSSQIILSGTTGFSAVSTSLSSLSSSISVTDGIQNGKLSQIETSTGSLNDFTSSINATIKDKLNTEGVISGSIQVNLADITGYSTFSSSIATTDLNQNTRLGLIEGVTGSYATTGSNTFDGNQIIQGYLGLNSDTVTIDNDISSSYIYTGPGDEGIYFRQNYGGLTSNTELRWMEGNLYTGLLYGGVISATNGGTTFNISAGKGIIVSLNATTTSAPQTTINEVEWEAFTGQTITNIGTAIQTFLGIDSSGDIIQQVTPFTSIQFNNSISLGTVLHQNLTTVNGSTNYPNVAYGYKQRTYDFVKAFGPLKLSGLDLFVSGSSTGSLVVASGTAYAEGRNYNVDPNNPSYITDAGTNVSKIFRYHQVSGTTFVQDTNGGAGYPTIDTLQYNNNGTLTTVPDDEWSIQRIFWFPNSSTKAILVYYGNRTYATSTEAIANLAYEPFVEVANTQQNAVYLGSLVIKKGANFTDTATYQILPGGLFRNLGGTGGGGTTVTNRLSDLSDVDVTAATNGQLFVYNSSLDKWGGSSNVTASLFGNASTATKLFGSVTINGTSFDGSENIVIPNLVSGSSQISITGTTGYSTFSSSIATTDLNQENRLNSIEGKTGSIALLNTYTGSNNTVIGTLQTATSSLNSYTSSNNTVIGTLQTSTSSLNSFTSSINTTIKSKLDADGVISGSSQVTFSGISGKPTLVSGSSQVSFNSITDKPTLVSGSSQITYGSISSIPSGIVSGSVQVSYPSLSNIPGGIVSGSSQIDITATTNYSSGVKTRLNAEGVVSGSAQILNGTGIWSGSAQLPSGVISGSAQLPSGIISGSSQLPSGIVSGSSQITLSSTTGYGTVLNQAVLTTSTPTFAELTVTSNQDGKLTLRVPSSGDSSDWNYINFVGANGTRDMYFGTDSSGTPTWTRDDTGLNIGLGSVATVNGVQIVTNSGTWAIGISGNAATATSATSATTATKLSGGGSAGDAYIILYDNNSGDLNTYNSPGIYSSEYIGTTNRPGSSNGHWIQISDNGGTDVKTQWYYDSDGANLYSRVMWGNGTWRSWKTMIHSGNIGSQSVSSATTATNSTNLSGLGTIQSTSTGTSYTTNYQVRENSGGGGNTNEVYAPQLAFHWSGVVASSIMMESSGRIAIRNNPGSGYENFIASTIYASSSFQGNLTGNVTGNVSGTANNITAYTINQSVGTSNSPTFSNIYANDWYRNNAVNEGLYNEATNNHWYSENNGRWTAAGTNATYGEISLRYGHQGTYKGSYYWDNSGIGLLNEQGGWSVRCNYGSGYGGTLYGSWTVTGTLTETSSLRYKTNIQTIESGLDKVLQMRGVVYKRKDNGKEEIGVIAEEMNEILPQVIQYNTESEIDSVSYSRIVGVLIEAIKELKQEINDLKNNGEF